MGRLAGVFVPWFLGQCWLVDVGWLYPLQRPIWTGKDMSADLDLRLAAISDFAEKTSEVDPGNLTKVKPTWQWTNPLLICLLGMVMFHYVPLLDRSVPVSSVVRHYCSIDLRCRLVYTIIYIYIYYSIKIYKTRQPREGLPEMFERNRGLHCSQYFRMILLLKFAICDMLDCCAQATESSSVGTQLKCGELFWFHGHCVVCSCCGGATVPLSESGHVERHEH